MPEDLRTMIAAHDGVFTTAQLRECGVTADAVRHRVAKGEWVRVARGVLRVADRLVDPRMSARIAVLRAGPGAALGSGSAAWWHGFVTDPPKIVSVIAPRTPRRPHRRRQGMAPDRGPPRPHRGGRPRRHRS